jgi:hypothetical protein
MGKNKKGKTNLLFTELAQYVHHYSQYTKQTSPLTCSLKIRGLWRDPSTCHTVPSAALLLVPFNQYTRVGCADTSSGCSVDLPRHFHKNSFITKQNSGRKIGIPSIYINPTMLDLLDTLYNGKYNRAFYFRFRFNYLLIAWGTGLGSPEDWNCVPIPSEEGIFVCIILCCPVIAETLRRTR